MTTAAPPVKVPMKPTASLTVLSALVLALLTAAQAPAAEQKPARTPAGTLRVGTIGDYPPFVAAGKDGELTGLDVDIVRRLAADLGSNVEFLVRPASELKAGLEKGDFDLIAGGVTVQGGRAMTGRYGRPYAGVGAVLVIRREDARRFNSLATVDQPGVRVAVRSGGFLESFALRMFQRASLRTVPGDLSLAQRVLAGTEEAALVESAEAATWTLPGLETIGPFTHDQKAFLFPAGSAQLAARVDGWIAGREADGWLNAQRTKWLGAAAAQDKDTAAREAVASFVRLRMELMPAVGAARRDQGAPEPERETIDPARLGKLEKKRVEHIQSVYRVLVELGRALQQRSTLKGSPAGPVTLAAALERIDDGLIAALAPGPPGTAAQWRAVLDRSLVPAGLDDASILRLAVALGGPEREELKPVKPPNKNRGGAGTDRQRGKSSGKPAVRTTPATSS